MTKKTVEYVTKTTPDLGQEQIERLKQIFPESVSEGKVDFDLLRATLGDADALADENAYTFTWVGKQEAFRAIQTPSAASLAPAPEESVNWESTQHLFIEGENLEVLKLLYKSYFGKVKMIYIDPPYNTGNDFIYRDDYSQPRRAYLEKTGQMDAEGNVLTSNPETSGRYHSDWLTMMYPRLFLARQLLREDGVIFVSIDDNEVHHLRLLMNEIFGEENFVASILWQKRTSPDARANLSPAHDYIMVFARSLERFKPTMQLLPLNEERLKEYTNPGNDPRGPWASVDITGQTGHATPSQYYEITTPAGVKYKPPPGRCWALSKKTLDEAVADGRIWFGEDGTSRPRRKRYLSEVQGETTWTWWTNKEVGHNQEATKELSEVMETSDTFDTPKPTRLIERMLQLTTSPDEESLVLDFFAGSSTTAHAVIQLNRQDSGRRRFIMIQIPEPTENPDFPTIAEIGKERVRRVIEQMQAECEGQLPLETREVPEDLGFKVFKLAPSTFRQWEAPEEDDAEALGKQLALFDRGLEEGVEPLHVIYEVALKQGYSLNARIEKIKTLKVFETFRVCDGDSKAFYICLDDEIQDATIDALPLEKETTFVCLDTALDDSQKVNLAMQCLLKVI